jgi:hypothetical protein
VSKYNFYVGIAWLVRLTGFSTEFLCVSVMYTLREGLQIQVLWEFSTPRGITRRARLNETVKNLQRGPSTAGLKIELLYNSEYGYYEASA